VCIVSKLTGNSWEVVPIEASDEHPKARFLKLPSGNNTLHRGLGENQGAREGQVVLASYENVVFILINDR
jgi:hypothetical protein